MACATFRALLGALALAGCYDPTLADGLPCSPGGHCPSDQQCDLAIRRCVPALDAMDAPGDFLDEFSRGDASALGNGWIEKNAPVYALQGGEVVRIATPDESYRDNMVYRSSAEDLLDVEISIRVRFTAIPLGYAQIFVRGVSATIGAVDSYDGYLLYVDGETIDELVLGRQIGTPFVTTLSRFTLSSPLNTVDPFRLVLRAEGTQPVMLRARVERFTGGAWSIVGETAAQDSNPTRIDAAGTVGFAGNESDAYVYDDFRRTVL